MKRIFTFLFIGMCVFGLKAQDVTVCNFNDIPAAAFSMWPSGTPAVVAVTGTGPASTKMLKSGTYSAGNGTPTSVVIQLAQPFNPLDYAGMSFYAQMDAAAVQISMKFIQSSGPGHANMIQVWGWESGFTYTGVGDWEQLVFSFADALNPAVQAKLDADYTFPADQYDTFELVPGAWQSSYTGGYFNITDIKLLTSLPTGVLKTQADAVIITAAGGTISAKATNGNPVALAVYSAMGQEVGNGVGQVSVSAKGVYVVKTTNGGVTKTSKIVVR